MDDRLSVKVTAPDGTGYRWGPDELEAGNVAESITLSTSDPGGFKAAGLALPRRADGTYPDLSVFNDVAIVGPGGEVAWEGRIEEAPASHGDDFTIIPDLVGWGAHLRDDPSFREIYVDRDLSRWGNGMSAARRLSLGATFHVRADPTVRFDYANGVPCVELSWDQIAANVASPFEISEAWYDSNGIGLGSIYYDINQSAAFAAPFLSNLSLTTDDVGGTPVGTVSLLGALNPTGTLTATGAAKSAAMQLGYTGTLVANGIWYQQLRRVAVFGDHGLTKRGTAPAQGVYGSDVVADIVGRAAPKLNFTTGAAGSIEASSFAIPHLVFLEPVTAEDAILAVNAFHQRTWGVEDDRTFFWRPTSSVRRRWRARLSDGAKLNLAGPAAENQINGVIVRFENPAGEQEMAGPVGSGCKTESSLLQDSSSTNAATSAGLRRWAILDIGFVTTGGAAGGAVQIGAAYLIETLRNLNVRGDVTLTGPVRDEAGIVMPPWAVRAGDAVTIEDGDGVERRIVETSYQHATRTTTCSLDASSHRLDSIMERMGLALVGAI